MRLFVKTKRPTNDTTTKLTAMHRHPYCHALFCACNISTQVASVRNKRFAHSTSGSKCVSNDNNTRGSALQLVGSFLLSLSEIPEMHGSIEFQDEKIQEHIYPYCRDPVIAWGGADCRILLPTLGGECVVEQLKQTARCRMFLTVSLIDTHISCLLIHPRYQTFRPLTSTISSRSQSHP